MLIIDCKNTSINNYKNKKSQNKQATISPFKDSNPQESFLYRYFFIEEWSFYPLLTNQKDQKGFDPLKEYIPAFIQQKSKISYFPSWKKTYFLYF